MKYLGITLASLGLASAATVAKQVSYEDWKVYRVNIGDNRKEFTNVVNKLKLEPWKGKVATSEVVDVMVGPSQVADFEKSTAHIDTVVMHENLGASIADETNFETYARGMAPNATWFDSYHPIADHFQWLKDLQAAYPTNSEIVVAGNSLEGRPIQGIHLWGSGGKDSKKAVVWHSTVHAREWITTMVNEYSLYQLVTATDANTKAFRDKYDFYIFPIVNPDGFAYTQTNDRMWRKNRMPAPSSSCMGTDINRNWDSHWSQPQGASTDPCAQDYKGTGPATGPETKVLQAFTQKLSGLKGIAMYLDIHSYSQLWMFPYGYTCSGNVPNAAKYQSLSDGAVAALKAVHGTTFKSGPICSTIYQVSGDSVDYNNEVGKADFSMTVELRDTGRNGFVLPANQIVPSGEEMWAGLSYVLANM